MSPVASPRYATAGDPLQQPATLPTYDVAVEASTCAHVHVRFARDAVNWLEAPATAICGYVALVVLSLVLGWLEVVRRGAATIALWPTFWFTTAALLLVMTIGRASDTGALLADLGRRQARSEGWYEMRRSAQAAAIGAIAAIWTIVVVVAVWRVPERRRRYLPTSLAIVTLVAFAGARVVSLHHVDAVLDDRGLAGLSVGAFVELFLIATVFVVAAQRFDMRRPNVRTDVVPAESGR